MIVQKIKQTIKFVFDKPGKLAHLYINKGRQAVARGQGKRSGPLSGNTMKHSGHTVKQFQKPISNHDKTTAHPRGVVFAKRFPAEGN